MAAKPKKWLKILSGAIALIAAAVFVGLYATRPSVQALPPLKSGDIVFQTWLWDVQSMAIVLSSRSPYAHTGIIKMTAEGPLVVEAVGPVREISLARWIDQGVGWRVAIMRMDTLKPREADKLLARARQHYGKPYDFFFLPDKKEIYCSELVEDAFKEGAGISLGAFQKVQELAHSSAMDKIIDERWPYYPPCQKDKVMTRDKCYKIIMQQELITPAGVARDPRLQLVYSNYPFGE
ncbi:MAG: YiiX/YebB-like N1pC/P60 family cysteine hydrolase [Alphaproteobacteria bacterium]